MECDICAVGNQPETWTFFQADALRIVFVVFFDIDKSYVMCHFFDDKCNQNSFPLTIICHVSLKVSSILIMANHSLCSKSRHRINTLDSMKNSIISSGNVQTRPTHPLLIKMPGKSTSKEKLFRLLTQKCNANSSLLHWLHTKCKWLYNAFNARLCSSSMIVRHKLLAAGKFLCLNSIKL